MNIAASSDKLSMALTPVRVAEDAVEIAIGDNSGDIIPIPSSCPYFF